MHHLLSEIVILFSEKGTDAMWPETPALTWWSLAAVVAVLLVMATCWRFVGKLSRKGRSKSGQIPLIEGIDMAWSRMGDVSAPPQVEGKKIFRDLTHQMFNGSDGAVRLYGNRPPLQSSALITNAHEYQFQEDCSATHLFNEDDRVVDLRVHRAEVKRWVKRTLAERRKAMQKRRSHR